MKEKHIMFDIETLSTKTNAIIATLGACIFDLDTFEITNTFYVTINWMNQLVNRHLDPFTVKWWMHSDKSEDVREEITKAETSLSSALYSFNNFIKNNTFDEEEVILWSDANFDVPIIFSAYRQNSIEIPVKYNNVRDARTIEKLIYQFVPDYKYQIKNNKPHHALEDAIYQAKQTMEIYKLIKEKFQ